MAPLEESLSSGTVSASELLGRLDVSPQTLMRRVRDAGGRVVRIGRGRGTRYGLKRVNPSLGTSEVALFRIDLDGSPQPVGRLVILAAGETTWLPQGVVFDGLPPEVLDMRPSGFVGRAFPKRYPELTLPRRIRDWSDDDVLLALARRGEDQPGNIVVGDESMERWFANPPVAVSRRDYPSLAEQATAGAPAGSSAAGEQPKFGAYVDGRHRLVKFAARGGDVATRWQDLLRLEALALRVLTDAGVDGALAEIVRSDSHLFLEIERFDRVGERGRRAAHTLAATGIDLSLSWAAAANRLLEMKRLAKRDADRLRFYEAFARCIANTDRHHYNIVLFPELSGVGDKMTVEPKRYSLAPAFDQLPMLYAPTSDGQLPPRTFEPPTPTADTWDVWEDARRLAVTFWQAASELEGLSEEMRTIAAQNAKLLR